MRKPRFTIITTCRNAVTTIERTICSVLDQGYDDTQYIVIDRGCTDETGEVISLYENELTWISERHATVPQAINVALELAEGEIVGFVDDLLLPGALTEVSRRMEGSDRIPWLVGQTVRVNDDDMELGVNSIAAPGSLLQFLTHDAGELPLASTFIRRSLLQEHGAFDATLPLAFDYEYACRLLVAGVTPTVVPQPLAAVREARISAQATLHRGLELVAAAQRYTRDLPLRQQYLLWRNCDERLRIHALAEVELQPQHARNLLWQQLKTRPWWIMDHAIRQTLMHGVTHPVPVEMGKGKAA